MGKFREAEQRFLQMAQLDSRSGSALNNLGNIYLATNRLDQAMEAYRQAIQLEPSRDEAYYNLGQAYLMRLRMKEAEAEFEKAKSLAPRLTSYYTSIASRNFNRLVIDRTIDPVRVWQRIVAFPGERDRIAGALWGILFGGVPLEYGEMAIGALLLLLGMVHLVARQLPIIRHCDRCGQLICSRCTRSRVMGTQCVQCLHAFTMNPSADPKVVKKKRAEAARYQTWLASFPQRISRIIPGFGHLFRDRGKEGILYLFISMLFLTKVLLWVRQLPNPMALNPTLSYPWVLIMAVLFLLFYSFVQYRMKKVRIQGGKSHFRRA
jgi:tetratricopeptide (TPR) repeat protein